MQSTFVNDIRIYNLSCGKSMPEWLNSKKRRAILKSDASLRNRIELIQEFEMPGVSKNIKCSSDGNYIVITGTYKPRVRCYDTNQLTLKFERCFDHEVIKFDFLSEDFTKLMFLQEDRWIEFHGQAGRYHRVRIPKHGADMEYVKSNCNLYIAGASPDIFSLNLEFGKFNPSITTDAASLTSITSNPVHELLLAGSNEGTVEAFDPRSARRVGKIDVALSSVTSGTIVEGVPAVSCLKFRDSLNLAIGTSTGQILLFDIRSSKPLVVKDHFYGLPIKAVEFIQSSHDLVVSMDSKIVKFWERHDGKPLTAIQTSSDLNDMCLIPATGLLFLANEDKKVLSYYIPSIGPAAKWCTFLDKIVEETEELNNDKNVIYDDYKFVTESELKSLGLEHLIGTNLLRAYMHGFFMDIRLYHKVKAMSDPVAFNEYKKKKIKEKIDQERKDRVVKVDSSTLPKVNRELVVKLLEAQGKKVQNDENSSDDDIDQQAQEVEDEEEIDITTLKGKKKAILKRHMKKMKSKIKKSTLLLDDRFKKMFVDPDFEIDKGCDEFKMSTLPGNSSLGT